MRVPETLLTTCLTVLSCVASLTAGVTYNGLDTIIISGPHNTLTSVAQQLAQPEIFAYDANTRTATCKAGISFQGSGAGLTIGTKGVPENAETLNVVCDPQAGVRSRGITVAHATLNIYNSKIVGIDSRITDREYRFSGVSYQYTGGGEIMDATIVSAHMGLQVATVAPVKLVVRNLTCAQGEVGLFWSPTKAPAVLIDGIDVSESIRTGMLVRLPVSRPGPVVIRNAKMGNSTLAVSTAGGKFGGSTLMFVNTPIDPKRVWFQDKPGFGRNKVVSAWEQYVRMTDFDGNRLPDGKLILKSTDPTGTDVLRADTTRMDVTGSAWVPLPVSIVKQTDGNTRPERVINRLEAASAISPYKLVKENWQETKQRGWTFERQNDYSWKLTAGAYAPPDTSGFKPPQNLCANGSFEIETCPGYADCWVEWNFTEMKAGGWGLTRKGARLARFGIDREHVYEGKKSYTLPPGLRMYIKPPQGVGTRALYKGKTYTVSFYAKSEKPDTRMSIWQWAIGEPQINFTLQPEWKRYSHTFKDVKKTAMLCFKNGDNPFQPMSDEQLEAQGQIWLDAVQIEEGEELHPFMPSGYVCPER